MLRPAHRVAQRRGLLPSRVLGQGPGYLEESLLRGAADLLDHLGRVPGEVALEDLEHAARVLQRHVGRARHAGMHLPALAGLANDASLAPPDGSVIDRVSLVTPARRIVLFALLVPSGEQARGVGVLEVVGDDRGRVGVDLDVLLEVLLVLEDVVDQAPQESDVGAGPDWCVDVTHRRGAREARVDVDELGALLFGDHGVPEANRVGLCHVGALDEDAVSVLQILQVGGGAAPTVRDAQTGHRGAVSYPRLVRDPHEPQRVEELGDEVVLLIVDRGASDGGQGHGAVQLLALRVFRFPGLLPGLLDPRGDHIERLLEREVFPLARVRPAVADLGPAVRRDVHTEGGRALRTERARVYGAVRVPLDVHNAPVAVVDERRAAYGTVGTHAHGLLYTLIGDARADGAGRRAYRVLDRRADVVPDLLPETVFLRELEEHARPLLCQRCDCPGFLPDSNLIHPVTKPRPKSYVQMCRPPVYVVSFLHRYATSGTLRGVSFGGKELAWISEMRPHAGRGKFGGAVERENKLLLLIVSGKRERRGFS